MADRSVALVSRGVVVAGQLAVHTDHHHAYQQPVDGNDTRKRGTAKPSLDRKMGLVAWLPRCFGNRSNPRFSRSVT